MAPTGYMFVGDPQASEALAAGWVRPDRRRFLAGFGAFKMPVVSNERASPRGVVSSQDAGAIPANGGVPVGEEPALMFRAAAASTLQPHFGKVNGALKTKGGYEREFDSHSKCGPDMTPYCGASMRPMDFMSNGSPTPIYGSNQWPVDQASHARSNGDSEVISSDGNSREPTLVTLALLPDTPSQSNNSSVPMKPSTFKHLPCLELRLQSDSRDWKESKPESPDGLHNLSLFGRGFEEERTNGFHAIEREWSRGTGSSSSGKEVRAARVLQEPPERMQSRGSGSSRESEDGSGCTVMDTAHMEQQYSANSDPMMLSDYSSGVTLWANPAYVKANAEKCQRLGKDKEAGAPYLDVLGIPTKLSSFEFLTSPGSRTKAHLWGFLKKFMTSESEPNRGNSLSEGRADGESQDARTPLKMTLSGADEGFPDSSHHCRPNLITPQPIRAVESTLTVERVVGMDYHAAPITENVERVKEELESKQGPAVITDQQNRVSWVNSAYKKLVGQPECSWLASTMGPNASRDSHPQSRLMGEVMLSCDEELLTLSPVFSCRVNVRWANDGDENSISVPSEVSRIDNDMRGIMFLWKLDPWSSTSRIPNGARRMSDNLQSPQSLSACQ